MALSDGKNRLTVRATDGVPQVGTDTFDFIVDTTAPVVTLSPSNPTISATDSPTFLFSVSNGVDEAPTQALCRIDSAAFAPCTTSSSYATVPPLTDGAHTFSVMATDDAGNIGDVVTHSFVVDTVAPTVEIAPTRR